MQVPSSAAHKKQRESLSPDDKVQILNKDADAHKKKWESLSPEDKALYVKNNTVSHWDNAVVSFYRWTME